MATKFIKRVTVSGIGEEIDPKDLIALSEEFPFVEYGILLCRGSKQMYHRFPSDLWLRNLVETCQGRGMHFSGHFCFQWVKEILKGKWPTAELLAIHPDFCVTGMFDRWQINTHAEHHEVDYMAFPHILQGLCHNGQEIIFQYDGENDDIVHHCKELGYSNVSILFDTSHGSGQLPSSWPFPLKNVYCGYSGGLTPDNLEKELKDILRSITLSKEKDVQIWIDAEGKLRTPDDLSFDLQKARAFLTAAKPFVITQ